MRNVCEAMTTPPGNTNASSLSLLLLLLLCCSHIVIVIARCVHENGRNKKSTRIRNKHGDFSRWEFVALAVCRVLFVESSKATKCSRQYVLFRLRCIRCATENTASNLGRLIPKRIRWWFLFSLVLFCSLWMCVAFCVRVECNRRTRTFLRNWTRNCTVKHSERNCRDGHAFECFTTWIVMLTIAIHSIWIIILIIEVFSNFPYKYVHIETCRMSYFSDPKIMTCCCVYIA